jgi:redox-sensitive bicupin YhaK (pirin superfamily)
MHFTSPYSPTIMSRGDVFSARQYPRQAFDNVIDPVLNIDWFEMKGPTFPAHPHAGFSAVTYLFADSPNGFLNRDSLGGVHNIHPGGLHWSRASSGIMHEETPLPGDRPVRGLQIFINLPADSQNDNADAFPLIAQEVVETSGTGWSHRTAIDGTGIGNALNALPSPIRIQEIKLDQAAEYSVDAPEGWGGIIIVLEGEVTIADQYELKTTQAIGFALETRASFAITAPSCRARLALVCGKQLKQQVYAHGPLMMASPEALDAARAHVLQLSIPRPQLRNL